LGLRTAPGLDRAIREYAQVRRTLFRHPPAMERGILLNMRRALQLFMLLCLVSQTCAASHTLVLVVRADSKVTDLDSLTVRKLFMGLPVLVDGSLLHPVRNRSDREL